MTDEDVVETEEEKRLQIELQELINIKNVYVALYNKQKLKSLVRYHRTTDIYDGIGEYFIDGENFKKSLSDITNRNKKPIIDPTDQVPISDTEIEPDDEEKEPKNSSKSYVYQTNVIWEFIKILDPNCKFRILSDGYVLFESEKLNKVFIENVWQSGKDGDFIRRGYGATILILDLDTFKKNQSDIIKRGRHGYKIDAFNAKKHLPQVQVAEGKTKTTGSIIHEYV